MCHVAEPLGRPWEVRAGVRVSSRCAFMPMYSPAQAGRVREHRATSSAIGRERRYLGSGHVAKVSPIFCDLGVS